MAFSVPIVPVSALLQIIMLWRGRWRWGATKSIWVLASCVEDSSNHALLPCRLRGWGLQSPPMWHDARRAGAPYVETWASAPQGQHAGLCCKTSLQKSRSLDSQSRLFPSGPGVALGGKPEEAFWGPCLQGLDLLSQPRQHHSQGLAGRSCFLFVNSGHALLSPFLLPAFPELHPLWQGEGT